MTKQELGELAMEILNTADTSGPDTEDGVITVDSDLLFRYYIMRGVANSEAKKKAKKLLHKNNG
jgi:hypothetical protein